MPRLKLPVFRFTFRKNCIIEDIEARNFYGIIIGNEIVVSLGALSEDSRSINSLIKKIDYTIWHEYMHYALDKCDVDSKYHHAIIEFIEDDL